MLYILAKLQLYMFDKYRFIQIKSGYFINTSWYVYFVFTFIFAEKVASWRLDGSKQEVM